MRKFQISDLRKINKIACIGIGGNEVYHTAKFFNLLEKNISGFDIKKSKSTKNLEKLGINITYKNPDMLDPDCDIAVYSDSLPDDTIQTIKQQNKNVELIEAGKFKRQLIDDYESGLLGSKEKNIFEQAKIAPLYKFDPKKMKLIGVTGTDGKTTTTSMIYHMLTTLGYKTGMITTIGAKINDKNISTGLHTTTPSSQEIMKYLSLMQKEKCEFAIIECTSQGLYMGRLAGLLFDVAVFTNITNEHLGYHKTWKNYATAKSFLITKHLKKTGTAVLNEDDKKSFNFLNKLAANIITYSTVSHTNSDLCAKLVEENINKIKFKVKKNVFYLPIIGKYNISNALAGAGALKYFGINEIKSLETLHDFHTVIGRMNIIQTQPFTVIIDFAHTPNGLLNALKTVNKLKKNDAKIILVFGCAAKRDERKRPVMGKYAKKFADITILTAEDCRYEGLKNINDQIYKGWCKYNISKPRELIRFDDESKNIQVRKNAIKKALSLAKENDIVLITGKGHEQSLCFENKEYSWNDIVETKKLLNRVK